jgi:PleD family two-component response regulator
MTAISLTLLEAASGHPVVSALLGSLTAAAAWSLHVWRLRRRERGLVALVEERTRQWQQEAEAHAALRERCEAGSAALECRTEAAAAEPVDEELTGRTPRVLVIDDRREQRDAITNLLGSMGVEPVFADSRWAATVATHQADADGMPYDLILIGAAIEEQGANGVV